MYLLRRITLDVLKPHMPNVLEFSGAIAEAVPGCSVTISVTGVDEKTETIIIEIEGENIDYSLVASVVTNLSASVHSIDGVEVMSPTPDTGDL